MGSETFRSSWRFMAKRPFMAELSLPLSNVQLELLKLYSTDLSEDDLKELKSLLAHFYAKKSIKLANQVWDEKGLSDEDMDKLLNDTSK